MQISPHAQQLRAIKAKHALSYQAIGAILGMTVTYVRGMHNGVYHTHPRIVRLLELELAEQKRQRRRRA